MLWMEIKYSEATESVPFPKRVRLFLRGFTSYSATIYDFESYDTSAYLSRYRIEHKDKINNGASIILDCRVSSI